MKFRFWLHKKHWNTSWKFQLEIRSNKKVIAKKHLTNLYEMTSNLFYIPPPSSWASPPPPPPPPPEGGRKHYDMALQPRYGHYNIIPIQWHSLKIEHFDWTKKVFYFRWTPIAESHPVVQSGNQLPVLQNYFILISRLYLDLCCMNLNSVDFLNICEANINVI